MGLFGKLFEKKECSICGGEIGLLGNRKLEDGNMCKDCAAKLSPWFSDRRNSTVQEITEQLQYREQNQEELRSFRAARSKGFPSPVYSSKIRPSSCLTKQLPLLITRAKSSYRNRLNALQKAEQRSRSLTA